MWMPFQRCVYSMGTLTCSLQQRTLHNSSFFFRLAPVIREDAITTKKYSSFFRDGDVDDRGGHVEAYIDDEQHAAVDCADWLLTSWQQAGTHSGGSSLITASAVYRRCLEEAEKCSSIESKEGTSFVGKDYPHCHLCATPLSTSYAMHQSSVEHQARVGVLERAVTLVNYYLATLVHPEEARQRDGDFRDAPLRLCTPAEEECIRRRAEHVRRVDWSQRLLWRWQTAIDAAPEADFSRMRRLSAVKPHQRLWRLRYLLRYLFGIKALQCSLDLHRSETAALYSRSAQTTDAAAASFRRSSTFERLELIGDNVFKTMVPNRLQLLFPPVEGGVSSKLALLQQLLDSNAGLIAIYDLLQLNDIIGMTLPNSKSKADVVEALIGELQTFVWAGETRQQGNRYACIDGRNTRYVCAVVRHTLEELTHVLLLWRLEATLKAGQHFLEMHTTEEFVRRHSQRLSNGPTGGNELDRKAKAAAQESKLERSRYDLLPLLSPEERYHPAVPPTTYGKENCYYSAHVAPVRASGAHELQRALAAHPFVAPTRYRHFYDSTGVPALTVSKPAYTRKHTEMREAMRTEDVHGLPLTDGASDGHLAPMCASPRWRRDEKERRCWLTLSAALEPYRLTTAEVQTVMAERLWGTVQRTVAHHGGGADSDGGAVVGHRTTYCEPCAHGRYARSDERKRRENLHESTTASSKCMPLIAT
ncbi:RNA editing complex protein MP67 [Strigomonas culicis]|uniref:RNA editing complex protein MP67 n=1 Tax=Strigomonas culicis TaxID=28005 RepID=S9VG13_9TRYP|nr:RNA editing complex protein MP67 [Strigomonas culicis]|eukprot:EPY22075.1 RNA editing complex protein MP67 [Strigomonas culicis]